MRLHAVVAFLLTIAITCVSSKAVKNDRLKTFLETGKGPGPRIVGGYDAQAGEFPYQVSVRSERRQAYNGHFCGGSILNSKTIVTAAHCMWKDVVGIDIGDLYIVAGTNLLGDDEVKRYVEEKLVHPDYGPVYKDYDIALLFLKQRLPLDHKLMAPVALQPEENLPAGVSCVASGWGSTGQYSMGLPNKLQGVQVEIIDWDTCSKYYMDSPDYAPVIETQLCAGFKEGKKDSCQGDSGGPLVCNGKLTGIVSWGEGCAEPRFPGVYSDVAFLLPWIEENMAVEDGDDEPAATDEPGSTSGAARGVAALLSVAFTASLMAL